MAAPLNMFSHKLFRQFFNLSRACQLVRELKRSPVSVYTAAEEIQLQKKKRLRPAPKKNPFLGFELSDPMQKNMVELAKRNHRSCESERRKRPNLASGYSVQTLQFNEKLGKKTSLPVPYVKLEDSDKKFGQAIIHAKSRRERAKSREVVLEGRRLVLDALEAGATIKELYFSGSETLDDVLLARVSGKPIYKVSYKEMKVWSDVDTPQGVIGIFEMPTEDLKPVEGSLPITLIFDQIRDPGNFGTLLRTAAAVGCQKVIAVKGCVDAWSPKVLRSGAGCHYRVPIITDINWNEIGSHIPEQAHVFIADSRKHSEEILEDLAGSNDVVDELDRLELEELYGSESDLKLSDSGSESDSESGNELEELGELKIADMDNPISADSVETRPDLPSLKLYRQAPLNTTNYDEASYVNKHTVIIIGGETQGISAHARKLAYTYFGQCVTIPMMAQVESLNCSVAGSIVLYEASKQFRHAKEQSLSDRKAERAWDTESD